MPSKISWSQIAAVAGGLAALSLSIWYLTREEAASKDESSEQKKKKPLEEYTEEEMVQLLRSLLANQETSKNVMKQLTSKLVSRDASLEEVYKDVVDGGGCENPLDDAHITVPEFDQLLEMFQSAPNVRELVSHIMGAPNEALLSERVTTLTPRDVVEIHEYMLEVMQELEAEVVANPKRGTFNQKALMMAAQIIIAAKVERKFKVTNDQLELAILLYHETLCQDPKFGYVNGEMQAVMSKFHFEQNGF